MVDPLPPVAVFVVGPESTGTRLLTRLVMECGAQGSGGHQQALDHGLPVASKAPGGVVWRRSIPHANRWPPLIGMFADAQEAGYRPVLLITSRDVGAMVRSQVKNNHAGSIAGAYERTNKALAWIMRAAQTSPVLAGRLPVAYEAITANPRLAMIGILEWMNTVAPGHGLRVPRGGFTEPCEGPRNAAYHAEMERRASLFAAD